MLPIFHSLRQFFHKKIYPIMVACQSSLDNCQTDDGSFSFVRLLTITVGCGRMLLVEEINVSESEFAKKKFTLILDSSKKHLVCRKHSAMREIMQFRRSAINIVLTL